MRGKTALGRVEWGAWMARATNGADTFPAGTGSGASTASAFAIASPNRQEGKGREGKGREGKAKVHLLLADDRRMIASA